MVDHQPRSKTTPLITLVVMSLNRTATPPSFLLRLLLLSTERFLRVLRLTIPQTTALVSADDVSRCD